MAKYIPTLQSTLETYQHWRMAQQRLVKPHEPDIVRVLNICGWMSPLPPVPELAFYARIQGDTQTHLAKALESRAVVRVRTVRSSYMLVERSMISVAIAATNRILSRRWSSSWAVAGVDEKQKAGWQEKILSALGEAGSDAASLLPKLPEGLRQVLPEAVQNKTGKFANLLEWLLTEMEEAGLIIFLDGKYFRFASAFPNQPRPADLDPEEVFSKLAERYFAWGNVASAADFSWWSGYPIRKVEEAFKSGDLPLNNLVLSGSNSRGLMIHSQFAEPLRIAKPIRDNPVFFLGGKDPYCAHAPFLMRRALDEKQVGLLFHGEAQINPVVLEQGRPVAVWRYSEAGIQFTPVGRTDPALRKRMQLTAEKVHAWLAAKKITLDRDYGTPRT